jgi:hypothetical protein
VIRVTPLEGPRLHTRNPQYGAAVNARADKQDIASSKNASPSSAEPQKAILNPFTANLLKKGIEMAAILQWLFFVRVGGFHMQGT